MTQDNRVYRKNVRVIVIKNDKILLGKKFINNKFLCYAFPGGGIEEGQSIKETVIKEMLEEVAIEVDNVELLNFTSNYEITYSDPERAKKYKGGEDEWCSCRFVKENTSLFNTEGDAMPHDWVTIDQAIKIINNGPYSNINPARINALKILKEKMHAKEKPNYIKW